MYNIFVKGENESERENICVGLKKPPHRAVFLEQFFTLFFQKSLQHEIVSLFNSRVVSNT